MLTFKHSGRMGDVFYSLYYCTHLAHGNPFSLVLRTGVSAWDPSNRPHMMERTDAEFMRPLLELQPYMRGVRIADRSDEIPPGCVNLDSFRDHFYTVCRREIRLWYYPSGANPLDEFERPVLSAPDPPPRIGRFAICFTPRYRECFDVGVLKPFRDELVFVGLPSEHEAFCKRHFPVEYRPVADALELLRFMQSTRGFIGNVSGTFAVAECAKIPRILCMEKNGGSVRVYGGGREARTASELETFFNEMRSNT